MSQERCKISSQKEGMMANLGTQKCRLRQHTTSLFVKITNFETSNKKRGKVRVI